MGSYEIVPEPMAKVHVAGYEMVEAMYARRPSKKKIEATKIAFGKAVGEYVDSIIAEQVQHSLETHFKKERGF